MGTNLGPLQPIADDLEDKVKKVKNWMNPIPTKLPGQKSPSDSTPSGGADPGMVEEANESFRKSAAAAAPKTPGKRMMQKRSSK